MTVLRRILGFTLLLTYCVLVWLTGVAIASAGAWHLPLAFFGGAVAAFVLAWALFSYPKSRRKR